MKFSKDRFNQKPKQYFKKLISLFLFRLNKVFEFSLRRFIDDLKYIESRATVSHKPS